MTQDNQMRLAVDSHYDAIDAEAFVVVFTSAINALREINRQTSEFGSTNVSWQIISASKNSPLQHVIEGVDRLKSDRDSARFAIAALLAGIVQLETIAICPEHFNEKVLQSIAKLSQASPGGITSITFSSGNFEARPTASVIQNAHSALSKITHERSSTDELYSYIEGVLQSVAGGTDTDKGTLHDPCVSTPIKVTFDASPELDEEVRRAWKKRVGLMGLVKIDRLTGHPLSIRVTEPGAIKVFPGDADLPSLGDMEPIDITDGVDSAEYIRNLRDVY